VADPSYPFGRAWRDLIADLDRYRVTDQRGLVATLLLSPGSVASIAYRLSRAVWARRSPLALAARVPLLLVNRLVEVWSGVSLPPQAQIGPGLYIGHFGQIIVNGEAVLGANCNLSQGVTIGVAGRGAERGCPRIGERVYIGPGAKLFGQITVGSDAAIGANAVVTRDVPDCAVVGGVPATVISRSGSFEFIAYRDMESDPVRSAAADRAG